MAQIFAFITADRARWEVAVEEYAKMVQQTEEEVREDFIDDTDFDAASDTIRLEDPMEERGWVDRSWGRYVLHESRNDVRPIVNEDEGDREELQEWITEALNWLGAFEDNGDGTFYGSDSDDPYDQGWSYSYAIHFTRKTSPYENGTDGWREMPWHPVTDGGFNI